MTPRPAQAPFGVYVHIPFCARRCDYCAFAVWTDLAHLADAYLDAVEVQAERLADEMPPVTSVFFGGGTPNLVDARRLVALLDRLPLAPDPEITVECNPDAVTPQQMRTYCRAGVDRISLGVQSMNPAVLVELGRTHRADAVVTAVAAARDAGCANLSIDLVYGAANETLEDWEASLVDALALEPDHLSAYGLTPEPGTLLWDDPQRHPDDDDLADKYRLADELLSSRRYRSYEISNWARPGRQCRHNLLYWRSGEYQGLGCAAHSHRNGRRFWNVRSPQRYIAAVAAERSGAAPVWRQPETAGFEQLDADRRRLEAMQLALRTSDGVPVGAVAPQTAHLVIAGADGMARLTLEGRLLANEVAVRLR